MNADDEWIPVREVLVASTAFHARYNGGDQMRALHQAESEIISRIASGEIKAKSHYWMGLARWEGIAKRDDAKIMKRIWWNTFITAQYRQKSNPPSRVEFNWATGDFSFELVWGLIKVDFGECRGLMVQRNTCYRITEPTAFAEGSPPHPEANLIEQPAITTAGRGGRKPANWWPDFAEELAMYLHDNGPPSGSGQDGQSEMIDAIFERLNLRGKAEPSRTQIQPVIREVIARLRTAGN